MQIIIFQQTTGTKYKCTQLLSYEYIKNHKITNLDETTKL